ncbi:type II toxin-antitoxin system RelE/ParE family toxin [Sedimenticola hydrogenitrophicus]|uniref:type II toxin-antitoxin system RelE/ParE family toxin n=1 Tax=Sedimenticola hydrogenitrophicus TaxID=2967975 RepID=UPI0023B12F93|nr:type II toxin-antitoxin system RelE/ParE family toxin [Sedimenticola hydrogenitrophicus]
MIKSFKDKRAEDLFNGKKPKRLSADIHKRAFTKLVMLNAAVERDDLKRPPGNHLEALVGDREGQYSIRINKQWRVCFEWDNGSAYNVEIVDYH